MPFNTTKFSQLPLMASSLAGGFMIGVFNNVDKRVTLGGAFGIPYNDSVGNIAGTNVPGGGTGAALWRYKAKTSATSGYPGDGFILWDNATQTSATHIILAHITSDSVDIDLFLGEIKSGGDLIIQDQANSSNYQKWSVTGTPTNTNGGTSTSYWTVPVSLTSSSGTGTTGFPNNTAIFVADFNAAGSQASIQFKNEGSNLGTSGTVNSFDFVGPTVTAARATNALTATIGYDISDSAHFSDHASANVTRTSGHWYRVGTLPASERGQEAVIGLNAKITSGSTMFHSLRIRLLKTTSSGSDTGTTFEVETVGLYNGQVVFGKIRIIDGGLNAASYVDVQITPSSQQTLSAEAYTICHDGTGATNAFVVDGSFTDQGTGSSGTEIDLLGTKRISYGDTVNGEVFILNSDGTITGTTATQTALNNTTKLASTAYADRRDVVTALSISSGVVNIDLSLGDFFTLSLSDNVTSVTLSNPPASGFGTTKMVQVTQNASAAKTVAWPSSFKWPGGSAGVVSTTLSAVDLLAITTFDQGTTYRANLANGYA